MKYVENPFKSLKLKSMLLIFNNDTFKDHYGVIPWLKEPEICYEGYPHLMIYIKPETGKAVRYLKKFHHKNIEVEIYNKNSRLIFKDIAELKMAQASWIPPVLVSEIKTFKKIVDANHAKIKVEEYEELVKPQPQVKVYGKVTDPVGKPKGKAYVMLVMPYGFPGGMAITKTNSNGFYEMKVPAAVYHHAYICDGEYGSKTLEFYGWQVPVKPPKLELNARFDKMEIYRLSAAESPERTLIVDFLPMDIIHTSKALERTYKMKGEEALNEINYEELLPPLKKKDINIFLDNRKLEILSFGRRRYGSIILKEQKAKHWKPLAYILEALIPRNLPPGKYNLKMTLCAEYDGIKEYGESILYGLNIW